MKSNFEFLNKYWPVLAQLGANAENYLYSDPNACIYKLGMFAERLVREILVFEHIDEPQTENTHANRIRSLKKAGLLPQEIDNTLYLLRKTRNSAVHTGTDSVDDAKMLFSMTYNLAVWFMETYGDWKYIADDFTMPKEVHQADLKSVIEDQEKKIVELSKKLAEVTTAVSGTTQQERVKRSQAVSSMMEWNEAQTRCLIDEQLRKAGWEADTVNLRYSKGTRPVKGNLVFMRKINSRILFEQMLGRATRICHEIGKTHFNIFDAVRVYEDLDSTSGMKSVSVSKTMPELLEDLFRNNGENKQQVKDRILARLQRKNNNLTATQKYDIIERLNGVDLKSYIKKLKSYTENTFVKTCVQDKDFLLWVDLLKREKKGYYYSAKPDILRETTRGYGNTEKPEDYLEAFAKFVNENKDKIEAIRIACTKPSDMTRAQLKELKLTLDKKNFTETNLNEATSSVTNVHIVADIIAYVRQAVLKTPIFNHDERVTAAFDKLTATHHFNKIQLDLLNKIKTYMLHESILNTETFEAPVFKMDGGFDRFNKKFGGTLVEIIREINTYIYEGVA